MEQCDRICIYPKDIQIITGKSKRYSYQLMREIRKKLDKEPRHLVTIEEFCQHTNLPVGMVMGKLSN